MSPIGNHRYTSFPKNLKFLPALLAHLLKNPNWWDSKQFPCPCDDCSFISRLPKINVPGKSEKTSQPYLHNVLRRLHDVGVHDGIGRPQNRAPFRALETRRACHVLPIHRDHTISWAKQEPVTHTVIGEQRRRLIYSVPTMHCCSQEERRSTCSDPGP